MGIKRIVDTAFWTDGKVDDFSPEDKYFMLYLLTNPFTTQLGIYEISIKQVAFQLGYSTEAVNVLIERFEKKYGLIIYSEKTKEIAIKNFLRHSIIKGGAPVRDCLIKEIRRVKDKDLITQVFVHIKNAEDLNETVRNIISDYEEKNGVLNYSNEKNNENENENENEVSSPVSYDDSYNDTFNVSLENPKSEKKSAKKKPAKKKTEKPPQPEKLKRGEYQHVLLTAEEEDKLIEEYGMVFALKAITFLDEYIEETGYKRKSHFLCIKRWVIDAVKEKEEKAIKNGKPQMKYGDFDPEEAMKRALARSMADAERIEDAKTAAENPELRERIEALKKKLS